MNNPFSRLKHYLLDQTDPRENHATECLAACLVFSSKITGEFIKFLFGEKAPAFNISSGVEVVTQQTISVGYIDLVLRRESDFVVAVEIKVGALEDCDQLKKYKRWLNEECKANHLFTLVRNPDACFYAKEHGATARRTWRDLHRHFKAMLLREDPWSEAEIKIINNLCDYLESEGIVSTYEMKDLLDYSRGVKARKAVTGIFSQVASRLETDPDRLESVAIEDRKDHWPQLRIRRERWKKTFGDGKNWKISLWFCVPGIWEAVDHKFIFEIELWHEDHGNDWRDTQPKLPRWSKALKDKGFSCDVCQTWRGKAHELTPETKFQLPPKKIIAWRVEDEVTLNPEHVLDEADLVNRLCDRAEQLANIVEALN